MKQIEPTLDDLVVISTKVNAPLVKLLDKLARRNLQTRACLMREILVTHLRQLGLVAPVATIEAVAA